MLRDRLPFLVESIEPLRPLLVVRNRSPHEVLILVLPLFQQTFIIVGMWIHVNGFHLWFHVCVGVYVYVYVYVCMCVCVCTCVCVCVCVCV